jgi:hypothetical protein
MQQCGGSSVNGLASVASIAGFTKGTAGCSITLSTSLRSNMAVPMTPRISRLRAIGVNLRKGPNLTGIDFLTGEVAPLFHPRRDRWLDHFTFRGAYIGGLNASGRATIQVLAMNDPRRLELRQELLALGLLA